MAEQKINFLTDKAVEQGFDTVRKVEQMGPVMSGRRAVPAGQLVGNWVEILFEEPDELMLWDCLVLGAATSTLKKGTKSMSSLIVTRTSE